MNNINCVTEKKNQCFGCNACYNICPAGAISMKEDEEGFLYPFIDKIKCTNCGLCKKACPSLNKSETYNNNGKNPDCYAIMADDEIRLKSSSGGAFTLIADYILDKGGYVCGVVWDKNGKAIHKITNDKKEYEKMRKSKYVQSDPLNVYSEIKKHLKENKLVLFTGTPCQVAALNVFLGKNYDNLYTVDLICHGVPSPKVWKQYLKETIGNEEFVNADFRDKNAGWTVYLTTTTTTNVYKCDMQNDYYLKSFLKNMCLRPSCGTCPFTSTQRESDITIGDFWAIERFDKKLNDKKGTSVILLNNEKGKEIFKNIKNTMPVCTKVPLEYAYYYNVTLYRTLPQHTNRQAFFRLLKEGKTLKEITDYCSKNKYDCGILNFWFANNYGGLLTCYALQETIKSLGFNPKIINYVPTPEKQNTNIKNFAQKNFNLTKPVNGYLSLNSLNSDTETFIVGSDCVFCPIFAKPQDIYQLSFADITKKKIAYAPSFGQTKFCGDSLESTKFKYYLNLFDHVSVREDSGIKICKEQFDVEATQVLDPVFLPNKQLYLNLIKNINAKNNIDNICHYIFKDNIISQSALSYIEARYKKISKNINMKQINITVSDWLQTIKNSEMLLTQSFHGACFAIIFNVPFIFVASDNFDNARIESILRLLNLENRILKEKISIENRPDLFEPIDWEKVNSILEKEKEKSLKWLKDALEAPKDLSKIKPEDAIIQKLNCEIMTLQGKAYGTVSKEEMKLVLNYKKNYLKYLKYKILKNFVGGKTKQRYKEKQKIWHEKIRAARKLMKG